MNVKRRNLTMLLYIVFTSCLWQMEDIIRRRVDLGRERPLGPFLVRQPSSARGRARTRIRTLSRFLVCIVLILDGSTGRLSVGSTRSIID
jgi:hypothetical protein